MSSYYESLRRNPFANWFVINLRFFIAYGFIPSGIKKIFGTPFANPGQQGAFMEYLDALHATGFYYEMIGWAQVIAAILLITQRFATLGAVIFLPIIFNIMVLTMSTIGSLTPLIACLMFLGIVFLLFWDYYKWINIFSNDNKLMPIPQVNNYPKASRFWIVIGVLILVLPVLTISLFKLFPEMLEKDNVKGIIIVLSSVLVPIIANLILLTRKIIKR